MPSRSQMLIPSSLSDDDDTPEVCASFTCAICSRVGREEYPDADTYLGPISVSLVGARLTTNGQWVCSQPCLSQLMFQSSSETEKDALRRYHLALVEVDEIGPKVKDLLRTWNCHFEIKQLSLDGALTSLGVDRSRWGRRKDLPAWIEANTSPEEELREVVRKAANQLEWEPLITLAVEVEIELGKIGNPAYRPPLANCHKTGRFASALGSLGRVILSLRAALNGEVAE